MPKKIYIDLETTGLDPVKNGIIQIAGIIDIGEGVPPVEFDFQVRPFRDDIIEDRAMHANGKTAFEVMAYPVAAGVHKQIVQMLSAYVDRFKKEDKFLIYGYNANFDAAMLRGWFEKCGDKYFGSFFYYPPIDILSVAGWILADELHTLPDFKLATVARHLECEVPENMHDALADIKVTKDVEEALLERLYERMKDNG